MNRSGLFFASALTLAGCAAHTQLANVPASDEPLETRVGAYERLRPVSQQQTLTLMVNRYGNVQSATLTLDHITLADGSVIVYPEDLLPAVDPESPTAQAALRSRDARRISQPLGYSGLAGMLVGAGILTPGILLAVPSTHYNSDGSTTETPGSFALLGVGIGVFVSGVVLASIAGFGFGPASARERITSFETYPTSLASRLGLCDAGDGHVTGCGEPARVAPRRVVAPANVEPQSSTDDGEVAAPPTTTVPPPTTTAPTTSTAATPASPTQEQCADGQVIRPYTYGHCCWPGQSWSNTLAQCTGVPRCPGGMTAQAGGCVRP